MNKLQFLRGPARRALPRPPARRCLVLLLAGCCAWGAAGCGDATPKLVPVAGKVTVDGTPLTGGTVSFRPDKAKGNTSPYEPAAVIDAQGNYKMYTPIRSDAPKEGAPPGWYKVAVISADPTAYPPRKYFTNPKYGDVKTSGLSFEVAEGKPPGAYDLSLSK